MGASSRPELTPATSPRGFNPPYSEPSHINYTSISAKMDKAIARAVNEKKPVPEIDFTLHTMEDSTQVSTMERVVKGNAVSVASRHSKVAT